MNQRVLLGPIAALTLLTTPALAQSVHIITKTCREPLCEYCDQRPKGLFPNWLSSCSLPVFEQILTFTLKTHERVIPVSIFLQS